MCQHRLFVAAAAVLGLLGGAPLRAELPKTLEEFTKQHEEAGKTPEGASKCLLDACFVYMDEKTRDEGRKMIQYIIIEYKGEAGWDTSNSARVFVSRLKDPAKHFIFRSYAKGTAPDNNYKMDPQSYELVVEKTNPEHAKGFQVYWKSSGADIARPVYWKQSTTSKLWYCSEHRNIYTEVRPPKDPNAEEFK